MYLAILIYRISHFATADEYTDTTLRVITIEKKQFGLYTCQAANKLGTAEAQLELQGNLFNNYLAENVLFDFDVLFRLNDWNDFEIVELC